MRAMLDATGQFDDLPPGRDQDEYGTGHVASYTVQIDPQQEEPLPLWDRGPSDGMVMMGQCICTFTARDEDPEQRDDKLEQLYQIAMQTLSGQAISVDGATFTFPAFTYFQALIWQPPVHPLRQAKATFLYRYLIESPGSVDTTP